MSIERDFCYAKLHKSPSCSALGVRKTTRMKHILQICLLLFIHAYSPRLLGQSDYVIITDAEMNGKDAYMQAVDELAKLRNPVMIINLNDQSLDDVFSGLKVYHPKYVAIVVHPETIESNFVGQVFEGLTKLDDDPLLDCAFGYITGMTSSDALRMVQSTAQSESTRNVSNKLVVIAHTFAQNDLYPFAKQNARRYQSYGFDVDTINPIDNSPEWRQKADNEIKKLSNATLTFWQDMEWEICHAISLEINLVRSS